jgi:hypothetical protein
MDTKNTNRQVRVNVLICVAWAFAALFVGQVAGGDTGAPVADIDGVLFHVAPVSYATGRIANAHYALHSAERTFRASVWNNAKAGTTAQALGECLEVITSLEAWQDTYREDLESAAAAGEKITRSADGWLLAVFPDRLIDEADALLVVVTNFQWTLRGLPDTEIERKFALDAWIAKCLHVDWLALENDLETYADQASEMTLGVPDKLLDLVRRIGDADSDLLFRAQSLQVALGTASIADWPDVVATWREAE